MAGEPAKADHEVEITPAMLTAGMKELSDYERLGEDGVPVHAVAKIFRAMLAAQSRAQPVDSCPA